MNIKYSHDATGAILIVMLHLSYFIYLAFAIHSKVFGIDINFRFAFAIGCLFKRQELKLFFPAKVWRVFICVSVCRLPTLIPSQLFDNIHEHTDTRKIRTETLSFSAFYFAFMFVQRQYHHDHDKVYPNIHIIFHKSGEERFPF